MKVKPSLQLSSLIDFSSLREAWSSWLAFWPILKKSRWPLLGAFGSVLFGSFVQILRPWPLKFLFDELLMPTSGSSVQNPLTFLAWVCGAILVIGILASVASYGKLLFAGVVAQRVSATIRKQLFTRILRIPMQEHIGVKRGEYMTMLLGDIHHLRDLLVNIVLDLTSSVVVVLTMLGIMFWLNPMLALVALATLPFVTMATLRVSVSMREITKRQRKHEVEVAVSAGEVIQSLPAVKLFGREKSERDRFTKANRKGLRSGLKMKRAQALLNRNIELFLAVGTCVFVGIGAYLVLEKSLTPGELLVFAAYMKGFQKPIRRLASTSTRMAKASVRARRILSVIGKTMEPVGTEGSPPMGGGEIEFKDVSFARGNRTVLDKVSFRIPEGSRVGVFGASGEGKSTLLFLIAGLITPDSGKILIGGKTSRDVGLTKWRSGMSAVFQDSFLLGHSILENLRFGDPEASEARLWSALEQAGARTFVESLPDKLDTVLAEGGTSLSGGERQRLAIARAWLRNAPIILLDEPGTGLDEVSKQRVIETLAQLTKGSTSFWATHEKLLLRDVDFTIHVCDGHIHVDPGAPCSAGEYGQKKAQVEVS